MSATQLIGTKVGEYEVLRRIGLGGMGAVYEGRHPLIGKRVAIKVLLPQFSQDEAQMKRFLAEARAVNEIRHRGIVDIFAFGELPEGARYFVMEFLEGASFEQLLKSRRQLPPVEALGLMEEVLDAVAAAHQAGIVHRDLKPSNIFLVDIGRGRPFVKLLDFGLAKLTRDEGGSTGQEATGIVGTPKYMAPEQVNGLRASAESDIYSLGAVLFELVSGRPPFTADSPVELMTRHLDAKPPRLSELVPGTHADLDRLVDRMLAKRPQDRPRDAESLRAEVARLRSRLDAPVRRGMTPQQRAALEEDVGPTVVRVVRRGQPATPDVTPLQSRTVGRVDPERTMIGGGPEPSLPWGDSGGPATTLDSDPDLSSRQRTVIAPHPPARPRLPAEQPTRRAPSVEQPVPTVPFPAPEIPKESPFYRGDAPVPTLPPTSQSAPTLMATDSPEEPLGQRTTRPELVPIDDPHTDRQPSARNARALEEAKSARAQAKAETQLGKQVLWLGLGAAGVVLILVLLALAL